MENLKKAIQSAGGRITAPEAAVRSGLSIDQAADGLRDLMEGYVCRLLVTDNGELVYDFGGQMRRRDAKGFREYWQQIKDGSWKLFKFLFRIWLTVTLVVYFVLFMIIILALLFSSQSGDRRGGKRSAAGIDIGRLSHVFYAIFRWSNIGRGPLQRRTDSNGYPYRHYEERPGVINAQKKNIIASVHDFVFGPARFQPDPLADEKEVAAFLVENKGIFVTADLQALAGFTAAEADMFFTKCLATFRGDVDVSNDGVVYGRFQDIARRVDRDSAGKIEYYWNEFEPQHEVTGNDTGRNLLIAAVNAFNLVVSFLIGTHLLPVVLDDVPVAAQIAYLLNNLPILMGEIPFFFSLLFFLIPLFRWRQVRKKQRERHHKNVRRRVFRILFDLKGAPATVGEYHRRLSQDGVSEKLTPQLVDTHLGELLEQLGGEMGIDDSAEVTYQFPRIARELAAAPLLRARQEGFQGKGDVVFDSGIS